ncbi:MAG: photosystem II reaction center protein Psb28 [Microcoleaceae cyanobacterium]
MVTSVQFIEGLDEEISGISLRKKQDADIKIIVLFFEKLQAMERLRAFRNQITNLWLKDDEGQIKVTPSGIKFFYAGDDDIEKIECSFEVESEELLERVMRFLHRYADDHGFEYQSN